MTDQKSLDDVAMLLMQYPGVSSARGWRLDGASSDGFVRLRFRCCDFASLKAISGCAIFANVEITTGNPESRLGYEEEGASDMPFELRIEDVDDANDRPTRAQILGVLLARDLRRRQLIDDDTAVQLQLAWNAVPTCK